MVRTKVGGPKDVVERNVALTGELMRYLLEQPQVLSSLPENFAFLMMILKCACNLELLDAYGSEGKPIVFARVKSSREGVLNQSCPSLYVPVVA